MPSTAGQCDHTSEASVGVGAVSYTHLDVYKRQASCSAGGSVRPLLDALRKIPTAAVGLKQYASRCGSGVSKTSDNDDSTASLGNSEELSVQHSVREPIPEFSQRPDDGTHDAAVGGDASALAGSPGDGVEVSGASNSAPCEAGAVSGAGAGR